MNTEISDKRITLRCDYTTDPSPASGARDAAKPSPHPLDHGQSVGNPSFSDQLEILGKDEPREGPQHPALGDPVDEAVGDDVRHRRAQHQRNHEAREFALPARGCMESDLPGHPERSPVTP